MILYPAIDLKNGVCVRLERGEMSRATLFNADPAAQARGFAEAGAMWLHVVDLDGAFAGAPRNADAVAAILDAVSLPVQLGGGIRDAAQAAAWLERGVARVILGTLAVRNPALVRELCREFPGKIAVALDARNGMAAVEGWAETTDLPVADLAREFADAGVAALIHTDTDRDGMMGGPNIAATDALARAVWTPVIASGGVSGVADIAALAAAGTISGAIIGRALYDGRMTLPDALAAAEPGMRPC